MRKTGRTARNSRRDVVTLMGLPVTATHKLAFLDELAMLAASCEAAGGKFEVFGEKVLERADAFGETAEDLTFLFKALPATSGPRFLSSTDL